jgi:glycosyltransferase involved in cell wall biosynthesis
MARPHQSSASSVVAVVIPAYRASSTIRAVVEDSLRVADVVFVVDDRCPERCGDLVQDVPDVHVIRHDVNRGVGGATKTGIAAAIAHGADIIVKVDSDGQMDASYVPRMVEVLESHTDVDMVKGNRFAHAATLAAMPPLRLIGNAGLTLLVKFSSGYWTIVDPTNGFVAVRSDAFESIDLRSLADRYFFEIDLLCALGLRKRGIAEMEMPARYAGEHSSLSISRVLLSFPPRLFTRFVKRLLVNYVVTELNVASLCALIGIPMLVFGTAFGAHEWAISAATGVSRPTGTIVLALLLFMLGFQLTLQALLYDVQFGVRTLKVARAHRRGRKDSPAAEPESGPVPARR